jgi:pSer/pThr/pTyr-binding forkhead associated (FHA) protein
MTEIKASSAGAFARIVIEGGPTLSLEQERAIVGRSPSAAVRLHESCSCVAPRHAQIEFLDGRFQLRVWGKSGALVNGARVFPGRFPVPLPTNALVEVPCNADAHNGGHRFMFVLPSSESVLTSEELERERAEDDEDLVTITSKERDAFQRSFILFGWCGLDSVHAVADTGVCRFACRLLLRFASWF